jgi:hypothetical protein
VSLATLLGTTGLWKGEISIEASHSYTFFIKSANNTLDTDPASPTAAVQVAVGIGYTHSYDAVDLETVYVAGATAGDYITLVGEGVSENQGFN